MVEKRANASPQTSSRMTREKRQAMASSDDTKEEKENTDKKPHSNDEDKKANVKVKDDMEKIKDEFVQLGRDLSMDVSTSDAAWASYDAIKQNYTLEGNQIHWLACALYVACQNSNLPTIGNYGANIDGNGVSLTRLLRSCGLPLTEFFAKVKKWADMTNLKSEFRDKIDRLQRNYAVSYNIFKKYGPIFVHLFRDPANDAPKVNRSRKQKKTPCTPGEVFDFGWALFVRVKADFPDISDDLVNSYHLLLCCVDYIYANAVYFNRTDLLNNKVLETQKLPSQMGENALNEGKFEHPCILDNLCSNFSAIKDEVKTIREHTWKPHIKKFFVQKLLKCEAMQGSSNSNNQIYGILETSNFEVNAKMIRKDYEAIILSVGEYDERIFSDQDATEELGTPANISGGATDKTTNENASRVAPRNLAMQFDGPNLIPTTPLSGKHYLRAKEQLQVTPVSTATYLVSRLQTLLRNRTPEPSTKLEELLKTYDPNPTEDIKKRITALGETFCEKYVAASNRQRGTNDSFAKMRLNMGVTLYYKLLEQILFTEKAKNKSLTNLLEHNEFHVAIFACSLEIVIFSYNSQKTFPWILNTFELEPNQFMKLIEIIIRAEQWLARDVVKHLQRIEEQVLESRAWTSGSPLFEAIERNGGVPSCEEVSLPGGPGVVQTVPNDITHSPITHHGRAFSVNKSPGVSDRFKSPVVNAIARRQLAFDNGDTSPQPSPIKTVQGSPIRPGQSLLSAASPQKLLSGGGFTVVSPGSAKQQIILSTADIEASTAPPKPAKTGFICIFFRKVYHLAHLRLDMLCNTLEITEDVKRKIWTTFEYTIRNHTDLMKDRHLDQLLMCSLYIVCKVVSRPKNFTDIMKHYRNQPQATSHVYRSVLLRKTGASGAEDKTGSEKDNKSQTTPPTPTKLAATSTIDPRDGEERGDLINFYNNVFMERLQEFSLKFKRSRQNEAPPLSPLPKPLLRAHPQSPCRKISDNHSVYIRPLKVNASDTVAYNPHSPHKPLTYSFSRSPAKDLVKINELMRSEVDKQSVVRKRLLADDGVVQVAGSTVTSNAVVNLFGASEATEEPARKVQIIGGGAVNQKLELILGDRT